MGGYGTPSPKSGGTGTRRTPLPPVRYAYARSVRSSKDRKCALMCVESGISDRLFAAAGLKEFLIDKDIVDIIQTRRLTYFGHCDPCGEQIPTQSYTSPWVIEREGGRRRDG